MYKLFVLLLLSGCIHPQYTGKYLAEASFSVVVLQERTCLVIQSQETSEAAQGSCQEWGERQGRGGRLVSEICGDYKC